MTTPDTLFLQIHALTPFAAVLLNRDDVGRAKRMPYGGVSRIRVSSQCQKRHWREVASQWSLDAMAEPKTIRSRKTFSREIGLKLIEEDKFAPDAVIAVVGALRDELLGKSEKAKAEAQGGKAKAKAKPAASTAAPPFEKQLDALDTNQVVVLGQPEVAFVRSVAAELLRQSPNDIDVAVKAYLKRKEVLANLKALRLASGLDAALFGRMVTSDILARGDGAIHVAHALTVHKEESEPDYFTAVDDITRDAGELGTGLIQTSELTSGLFYAYVVIDVPLLVSNLEGVDAKNWRRADRSLAARVIEQLVHAVATTSPGAKKGSTAPYGYADLMLVEAGQRQPRSLMTAFYKPVHGEDARQKATDALGDHLTRFDAMYGAHEQRRVAALLGTRPMPAESDQDGLAGLARWAGAQANAETEADAA